MRDEVHICGVLVQAHPLRTLEVGAALAALPQAEVCASNAAGRIVVVCECADSDETLALIARMRDVPGVASVALVYQHAESAAAMEEEIGDETDPPRVH